MAPACYRGDSAPFPACSCRYASAVRRIRIGAYAVCTDAETRLLVCRISPGIPEAGAWTLPGGGVEFGEHPDLAVLRELEEEAGLSGRVESMVAIDSWVVERPVSGPGPMHQVAILYRVAVTGGDLRDELDGSTDCCAWMSASELDQVPTVEIVDLARRHVLQS
jgi:8-oxo-dGTP diphosphatase